MPALKFLPAALFSPVYSPFAACSALMEPAVHLPAAVHRVVQALQGEAAVRHRPVAHPPAARPPSSGIAINPVDAGKDQQVFNGEWVRLNSGNLQNSTLKWRQLTGPTVNLDPKPATGFIAPDVRQTTDLRFELSAQINGQTFSDTVNVRVEPCSNSEGVIFGECISPGFGPFLAYESAPTTGEVFNYQGSDTSRHVQWQAVDTGDNKHGRVMEIRWNANDPNHSINANGWFGLAMPGTSADLQAYKDGAISFDMRLTYHEQPNNAAPFIF